MVFRMNKTGYRIEVQSLNSPRLMNSQLSTPILIPYMIEGALALLMNYGGQFALGVL